MDVIKGKTIAPGWASGTLHFYHRGSKEIPRRSVTDIQEEEERYESAKKKAAAQLDSLRQRAIQEVGELNTESFEIQKRLLESPDYNEAVQHILKTQRVNAEYAVAAAGKNFADMFEQMAEDNLRIRAKEIREVTDRIVEAFFDREPWPNWQEEAVILAADHLTPGETVQLDKQKIRAILLREGAVHSHGAVLARSMGIPALAGIPLREQWEGRQAAVKGGEEGELILNPEEEILQEIEKNQQRIKEQERLFQQLKGKDDVTPGGRKIMLYANVTGEEETAEVLANDAGGIGLFRSEFLYLNRRDQPDEEEQFQIYKRTAENMGGRPVFIRTVDLGTDKRWIGADPIREENPALGYRGIRYSLGHPELFRTQLRAILRAASFGNIGILYPMITSMAEVWQIKKILEAVHAELTAQGVLCPDIPQGIMIETPAAALMSDALAPEVDFLCIGSNDLIQYVLAADRQNPKLEAVYDPHHPVILRLIRTVIENGHKGGCPVTICGELGEDPELTEVLLKMGMDGFSVPPSHILPMRQRIREAKEG